MPVDLCDEAAKRLLPQDYEFLQTLHEDGPLEIEELQARSTAELSQIAIRERLWLMMGLDRMVDGQDQLIDHSATSAKWGRPADIDDSERGRIPDDNQTLQRRIEDERIRRSLDLGFDRQTVAERFDVCPRTTRYKERRARAYAFPLDAVDSTVTETSESGVTPSRQPAATGSETSRDTDDSGQTVGESSVDSADELSEIPGDTPMQPAAEAADDHDGAEDSVARNNVSDDTAPTSVDTGHRDQPDQDEIEQGVAVLSDDDADNHRLLLTVGLDGVEKDALMRYCAEQQQPLSGMLKEWMKAFAAELAD